MPRSSKVYTRTGDNGTTALGTGRRVPKTDLRIQAYGTVDELNAQLGVVLAADLTRELAEPLRQMQSELFHAGAELCVSEAERDKHPGPRIEARHIERLEQLMDRLGPELEPLQSFVLPGGTLAAAHLHVARTICRRAERAVLAVAEREPVGPNLIKYLNRLSDTLFVMARYENKMAGVDEPSWDSRA